MSTTPTSNDCLGYVGGTTLYEIADVNSALEAELTSQLAVCKLPDQTKSVADYLSDALNAGGSGSSLPYPADMGEALLRRVAHSLKLRTNPLGVLTDISDMGTAVFRIGGTDAEVARLEAPYRKLVVG